MAVVGVGVAQVGVGSKPKQSISIDFRGVEPYAIVTLIRRTLERPSVLLPNIKGSTDINRSRKQKIERSWHQDHKGTRL